MSDKIRDRIAKLLALAESSNPHEAELATKQAERLMVKWGIEAATLEQGKTDDIVEVSRNYTGPYTLAEIGFVQHVCLGLGNLRFLQSQYKDQRTAYLIGHKSDVERAEMLLNSLEVQARAALWDWWRTAPERTELSGWDGYKARRQFLVSFAYEVSRRLWDLRKETIEETGKSSTELVLVSRQEKVDQWVDETYPDLRRTRGMHGSSFGASAGRAAGSRASLGEKSVGGTKGALR